MMRPGMIGQPACGYVYCVWYSAMWVWFGGTRRVCVCVFFVCVYTGVCVCGVCEMRV